jgi:hypothetical protein
MRLLEGMYVAMHLIDRVLLGSRVFSKVIPQMLAKSSLGIGPRFHTCKQEIEVRPEVSQLVTGRLYLKLFSLESGGPPP